MEEEAIQCPKCRSTQVSANRKGWSLMTGAIGSGRVIITCLKCGHKFGPGGDYASLNTPKMHRRRKINRIILLTALGFILLVILIAVLAK